MKIVQISDKMFNVWNALYARLPADHDDATAWIIAKTGIKSHGRSMVDFEVVDEKKYVEFLLKESV